MQGHRSWYQAKAHNVTSY